MSERPTTCPKEHTIEWLTDEAGICACQGYLSWDVEPFFGTGRKVPIRIIASEVFDAVKATLTAERQRAESAESALAQLTTENDHYRAALQEVNALALEAAAKYDRERQRAAILTEQRDEAVAQSIGLAQESDRLLDVHTELGLPDDGDAVAAIKKLRQARERAEAACAAMTASLREIAGLLTFVWKDAGLPSVVSDAYTEARGALAKVKVLDAPKGANDG